MKSMVYVFNLCVWGRNGVGEHVCADYKVLVPEASFGNEEDIEYFPSNSIFEDSKTDDHIRDKYFDRYDCREQIELFGGSTRAEIEKVVGNYGESIKTRMMNWLDEKFKLNLEKRR